MHILFIHTDSVCVFIVQIYFHLTELVIVYANVLAATAASLWWADVPRNFRIIKFNFCFLEGGRDIVACIYKCTWKNKWAVEYNKMTFY